MSGHSAALSGDAGDKIQDLRRQLGLFSFQQDNLNNKNISNNRIGPELFFQPGGLVEWLTASPGAGAVAATMPMMSRHFSVPGILAIVDPVREFHAPAISGWGVSLSQTLLVCPKTRQEACWAVEQCLRCPGVSAVWAWVGERFPTHVLRRWQLAAEAGGGVGWFFRPEAARREPTWAHVRLLVTPLAGLQREARRVRVDVLYHRGGLGGTAQVWEIDHAEGVMRVVPELADPAVAERAAGA
jgi:protein ImuA